MSRSIRQIQQDLAEQLGYRSEVIWDLLSSEQSNILKNKIEVLLPDKEQGQNAIKAMRDTLFEQVWAQRKYTNQNSLSALIYVFVTKESNNNRAPNSKEFSCHPVFRTRKCVAENANDSSNCCMIFIDEVGRVYQNWREYLQDNELPKGSMVVPTDGIYTFDESDRVNLDVYDTPASSVTHKLLAGADTTSTVAGVMAVCVPVAALLTVPVSAPIMAGAAVVGMASAGYATIRSGSTLVDRSTHEQSISITDHQARNSWLSVFGGIVGFGASGATRALTSAAVAGSEISAVTELLVNGMNISSIVLSGAGAANGILDLILRYSDNEDISALDVLQLAASLVLLTHSVYNFNVASTLINNARNSSIQTYRNDLSNRQRRAFDKLVKETIRIHGENQGKIDIIRGVNDIPSKQYLNDLYKINKELNKQNVRPAFGSAGEGIVLNNEMPVDTQNLRGNIQMLDQVNSPIPQSYRVEITEQPRVRSATLLFTTSSASQATQEEGFQGDDIANNSNPRRFELATLSLTNGISVLLSQFSSRIFENISDGDSFETVITTIGDTFGRQGVHFFMNLTEMFIDNMLHDVRRMLNTFIPAESILYRLMIHCLESYQHRTVLFLQDQSLEILESVQAYFLSMNTNSSFEALRTKCKHCAGYFMICDL